MRLLRFLLFFAGVLLAMMIVCVTTLQQDDSATASAEGHLATTTNLPDLVMQLSVSPLQVTIGQSVMITRTVRNDGAAFARDFCSYIYVDPPVQPPLPTTPGIYENCLHVRLDPGLSYAYAKSYSFTSCGRHMVYAWVDPANTVIESNEGNNLDGPVEVLVTGCNVPGTDTYEPDDTCRLARPVAADGVHYRHTLWPVGDQDWIRVDMVAGLQYVIRTEHVGADGDTRIDLWDYCQGKVLAFGEDTLGPGATLIWQATATGPHYAQIRHTQPTHGPDTHYDLWVEVRGLTDVYEPDDTCQSAREIVANAPAQNRAFNTPGDEDWLRFQAVAGLSYRISTESLVPEALPLLSLHRRCGEPPVVEQGAGHDLNWAPSNSGQYYLRVRNNDPLAYGPTVAYRVRVIALGSAPDPGEPDNGPANARMLPTNGAAQSASISSPSDHDWFYFDAVADQTYRIETFNLGPEADTVVCLYSAMGTSLISCDDDSGPGFASRIWWRAPAAGRYYVKVRDYRQDIGGHRVAYQISATAGAPICDRDAYESDNAYYEAKEIRTDGTWQIHNTCPDGDIDWVRFWTSAGRTLAIETSNLGLDSDTLLTLYDIDGRTPLWSNDDAGAGLESQIVWTFLREGVYYIKAEQFGRTGSGRGTEFDLHVVPSSVIPTPTPTPTPRPTPSPSPTPRLPPSAHTLIVTNSERVRTLYGEAAQREWMSALVRLAGHDRVRGVVVDAAQDGATVQSYAEWIADLTNVDKANRVSDAVRNLIMRHLAHSPDIAYIVIAGDDRVVPYRRVADRPALTKAWEHRYSNVSPSSTIGAALAADMSLNDDFYADREPIIWDGQPVYLPDVAIARLVEEPAEVIGIVDAFLGNPDLTVNRAFVAGYQLQEDAARQTCQDLTAAHVAGLSCELVGGSWGAAQFQALQLRASPRYDLQALFMNTLHYVQGSPAGSCATTPGACTYARDIVEAPADLRGVMIWQSGPYGGLNVPPGNPVSDLDLPQAFARKGANYAGNTGAALFGEVTIMATERLMNTFARELIAVPQITIGEAWMRAKRSYYNQTQDFSEYDRKVLSVATLYGLPMVRIHAETLGGPDDPFPSVAVTVSRPLGEAAATLQLNLQGTLGAHEGYFDLDGHASISPHTPPQPQYFTDLGYWRVEPIRGAVWTGGTYTDLPGFQPLRPDVMVLGQEEPPVQAAVSIGEEPRRGWSPAFPGRINPEDGQLLAVWLGQYDEDRETQRLYSTLTFDLYSGDSPDRTPPDITWAAARSAGGLALFKVRATDPSGVQRVTVTYTQDNMSWFNLELRYDEATQKWIGSLPAHGSLTWLTQAIDRAGNSVADRNKERYYYLPLARGLYLPMVVRQTR